jgi:endoglucanase
MMRGHPAACLVLAVTVGLTGCGDSSTPERRTASSPVPAPPTVAEPRKAMTAFLDRYVTSDGRVIRHDQGGDIVSEGQAYGMLIAELAGRPDLVRTVWSWTAAHLRRADGLLKYHASGSGEILDDQSAADADVLAGYALLRYRGPDEARLHADGKQLAHAVLEGETVAGPAGPVVVAGPWATGTEPPTVNPSYLMPSVFEALGTLTGDHRWQGIASSTVTLVSGLTHDGAQLPTDWAHLEADRLVSAADPAGGAPVQYGLDAARLPLWFGTACSAAARRLAARWWTSALSQGGRAAALALNPNGQPLDRDTNPLPLLAAAAAAAAAGDQQRSRSLRERAAEQARSTPTYYGDAWLALGGALLDRSLDPCKEAGDG